MNRLSKALRIPFYPSYLRALGMGAAAGVEHEGFLRSLDCSFVVDIGANRGQFALVARRSFPDAKIIAFEPLQEPAAIFRKVFAADADVVLHEIAIGPGEKETVMHVSRADDSSSLLPITDLQNNLFPGTDEKELRTVKVRPLDAALSEKDIRSPALLKIDVQGFEREVLRGCETLLPCFSYIYVECSFVELYTGQALADEVMELLHASRFRLSGIYNMSYDRRGIAIQGDFLFERA